MDIVPMNPGIDNKDNVGSASLATAEVSGVETLINNNTTLQGSRHFDTRINYCPVCNHQLLKFAMAVHCHKVHTIHVEQLEEGR